MTSSKKPRRVSERRACILCVGTELTEGIIQDTHMRAISAGLTAMGITVRAGAVIPDDRAVFTETLSRAVHEAGIVIITGGLGPTSDDLAREVVAEVAGVPLEFHPEAWEAIRRRFPGAEPPAANRVQAMAPAGFALMENPNGTAPGFQGTVRGALVIALPGPPRELGPMYRNSVEPILEARFGRAGGGGILWATAMLVPESALEEALRAAQESRASAAGKVFWGTRLDEDRIAFSLRGGTERAREEMLSRVIASLGDVRVRRGDARPAALLIDALKKRRQTAATAESCTGGLIAKMITDIPGASAVYWGGFVTYANEAKSALLGVREETLAAHGAVSEETVKEMADGARARAGCVLGISVSGIAGPEGGSPEKPVGTVWIGVSYEGGEVRAARFLFTGGRDMIRRRAAVASLLFSEAVLEGKNFP